MSTDPVTAYANSVVAGKIVAGPHVRNACRRHLNDLEEGPKRGLVWDVEAVARTLRFFPSVLCLAGGQFEGLPFVLQPSQEFTVGSLFGWKRSDGMRRFRRAYVEEAKGSGKSPLAAGVGLYCLIADDEFRAEVYAAASKRDQAMILFRDAVAMWQQSPWLRGRLTASGGNPVWNLADLKTGSFFRAISSEQGQSGPRPSCALCDEIHEHRDGRVIELLERGFKWRRQPLLLMITNAGSDRNSVCWEEHQFAVKVAAGEIDPIQADPAFSYVCALDENDDPLEDSDCWVKANPLVGVTITKEYLGGVVAQAKAIPGKLNNILRLHFCTWTDAERAWMTRETLEKVIVQFDTVDEYHAAIAEHQGKELNVGIDLSASQDFTVQGFAVNTGELEIERLDPDGTTAIATAPTFDVWIEAWTPGDTLAERAIRDSAQYEVWEREGWLNAPAGRNIRMDYPAAHLADLSTRFKIRYVAYDRYAYRKFEEELDALNFDTEVPILEHPQGGKKRGALPPDFARRRTTDDSLQGLWMPGSVMELEAMILERRIRLFGNPVLISACMSAVFEEDPWGNRWFSKRRALNRIDALVAVAMAIGAAMLREEPEIDVHAMVA